MEATQAIEILTRQRHAIQELKFLSWKSPLFTKWRRNTEVAIERIFGPGSRHLNDFADISYTSIVMSDAAFQKAYGGGLDRAYGILSSMIDEITEYGFSEDDVGAPDTLSLIEKICLRFHVVARQLRSRHQNRPTIEVEDEYDVQDLFHALLRLNFDDVRSEEWTPSYAGGSSRVDFLLKLAMVIVEIKKTRASLTNKAIGEQLLIDIARYRNHPDCSCLVCFIYDPEGRIGNPAGLERDLESNVGPPRVRAIIGPKGT